MKLVTASQVVFGTDFPSGGSSVEISKGLSEIGFSDGDLRAIDRENAVKLLRRGSIYRDAQSDDCVDGKFVVRKAGEAYDSRTGVYENKDMNMKRASRLIFTFVAAMLLAEERARPLKANLRSRAKLTTERARGRGHTTRWT